MALWTARDCGMRARCLPARSRRRAGSRSRRFTHSAPRSYVGFRWRPGVSPLFREMEDRAATLLRQNIIEDMAGGAEANLVADFARYFTGTDFDQISADIAKHSNAFAASPSWNEICGALKDRPPNCQKMSSPQRCFWGARRRSFPVSSPR